MKRLFVLTIGVVGTMCLYAQPNYPPAVPQAQPLAELEYYVDRDPGIGNGTRVTLPVSGDVTAFSFNASLLGVAPGFHRFYIRSIDGGGRTSHTWNTFFDNFILPLYAVAPPAGANITAMEYFIDTDPGMGFATPVPIAPHNSIADQQVSVNVANLAAGLHRLYFRSRDANGKWSLTYFAIFDNAQIIPYVTGPSAAGPLTEMEYYIDTDPGFGNGHALTIPAGTEISNLSIDIPLNAITAGPHTLYLRSRQNPWSMSAYVNFSYGGTLPVTWLYVKGRIVAQQSVIEWATASEENTKSFVVEHSLDGRTFTEAGAIPAAGNSSTTHTYRFNHTGVANGFNYYRIRQVDIDGRYTWSKVIALVDANTQGKTIVGPNPAGQLVHILEPNEVLIRKVELFDMTGRLVLQKPVNTKVTVYPLSLSDVIPGNYLLKVSYENKTETFKIIKQ